MDKESETLVYLSREVLVKVRGKNQMHKKWKQGQVAWEEYIQEVWLYRGAARKGKTKLELNMARDAKNNKKGFSYFNKIRSSKKVHPPDKQHWETSNNRWGEDFVSIFNASLASHTYQVSRQQDEDWGSKMLPDLNITGQEKSYRRHLSELL